MCNEQNNHAKLCTLVVSYTCIIWHFQIFPKSFKSTISHQHSEHACLDLLRHSWGHGRHGRRQVGPRAEEIHNIASAALLGMGPGCDAAAGQGARDRSASTNGGCWHRKSSPELWEQMEVCPLSDLTHKIFVHCQLQIWLPPLALSLHLSHPLGTAPKTPNSRPPTDTCTTQATEEE